MAGECALFTRPVSHPVATNPAAAVTSTHPETFIIFADTRTPNSSRAGNRIKKPMYHFREGYRVIAIERLRAILKSDLP